MNDRVALVEYEAMCAQIARVERVDEAKSIRDKHKAMQAYANQAMNFDAERQCARIRIRAERRAGELLTETAERGERATQGGDRKSKSSNSTLKLADVGITKDQSSQWQKLAQVPEQDFEAALAAPGIPSTAGIVQAHRPIEPKPVRPISDEALWLWGRLCDFERDGYLDADLNALASELTPSMRADVARIGRALAAWLTSWEST